MPRRPSLLLTFAVLLTLPCTVLGAGETPLQNAIYLGNKTVLEAMPTRQLTLNAHIKQFQYQPGGLAIAYVGGQSEVTLGHLLDSPMTEFVKVVGVRRGTSTTLFSNTVAVRDSGMLNLSDLKGHEVELEAEGEKQMREHPAEMARLSASQFLRTMYLLGWSADARYLLASRVVFLPHPPGDPTKKQITYLKYDVGITPTAASEIAVPWEDKGQTGTVSIPYWSPGHHSLAFDVSHSDAEEVATTTDAKPHLPKETYTGLIYDLQSGKLRPLSLQEGYEIFGWLNATHLLLVHIERVRPYARTYASYDITTGQQTAIPKPLNRVKQDPEVRDYLPFYVQSDSPATTVVPSPTAPDFSLEVQAASTVDPKKVSEQRTRVLWLRRRSGTLPLSALSAGVAPGDDDPKPQWSPTGSQIAYLSHGDLFVTDLATRPASLDERLLAGDKLTCAEEKEIAVNRISMLGSALTQYATDHKGQFPDSGDVREAIVPHYILSDKTFGIGKASFVYQGGGLSVKAMEKPAEVVLGTLDLPCAKLTLYADGHVATTDK